MKNLSLREYEQFSAYLDGQLSAAEKSKLEEQIKSHPDWRLALDELASTRAILRRAPRYRAPRNFTISPEVARQYARKTWLPSFVSFRLSSAVAALSIIIVMILQFLPSGGLTSQVAMAPAADVQRNSALAAPTQDVAKALEPAPELAPQTGAAIAETPADENPPVILWNPDGSQGLALGRGGGGGGGAPDSSYTVTGEGIVTYNQEKVGSPMYGGAADSAASNPSTNGGIVNYGGAPSPDQANSANIYAPPYNVPPQSAETLPEQPAQSLGPSAGSGELEGSGPILGVPSQDTAGQIIAVGPITNSTEPDLSIAISTSPAETGAASFWSSTRIAQAGLLGLALLAGVVAVIARRRAR